MATTKQTLIDARSNPNVAKFLNLISRAEGTETHGYNTAFGGGRFEDFSKHPNIQKKFTQTDGKVNSSGASGRYQFMNKTWNGVAKKYGLNDFSPINQDLGAIALIADSGALKDVESGNFKRAIDKLGSQWASFPSAPKAYKQKTRSYEFLLGKDYADATPAGSYLQQAINGVPASVGQAYQDIVNNYNFEPVPAVTDPRAIAGVAKAPNEVDQLYGYNPTLSNLLGAMSNPTPSPQNTGVMSPLASVLFKTQYANLFGRIVRWLVTH